MARPTPAEEIIRLETELATVRSEILQVQSVKEMEEGGSGARFRSVYTDIAKLRTIETTLQDKLTVLYGYTA